MNISIVNRKAKFEYEFLKSLTAGIQLKGSEVKAIKDSRVNFVDSYCFFNNGEIFLRNLNISANAKEFSHDPLRERKLLLKKKEIKKLENEHYDGLTIVPYRIFENERGLIKVEIILAKGRKLHNKKEAIKERDIKRQTDKDLNR